MKYNDKSLGVKQKVLYSILEIVVFSVIWMFVGPCFIDINTHSSMDILDLDNTKLCWFLYGYSLYKFFLIFHLTYLILLYIFL